MHVTKIDISYNRFCEICFIKIYDIIVGNRRSRIQGNKYLQYKEFLLYIVNLLYVFINSKLILIGGYKFSCFGEKKNSISVIRKFFDPLNQRQ